jgi:hypothetical protein
MPKPLFTTFPSSDTVSQHFYGEVAANFPAVLEAVSNCLRRAVNTNGHTINPCIDDSLCEGLAGESDEAQPQAIDHRLFRFWVDGHPNRTRVKWKKAVEPKCGLKANNAIGYARAREHYLALKSCGEILTRIKPPPDLQKESTLQGST